MIIAILLLSAATVLAARDRDRGSIYHSPGYRGNIEYNIGGGTGFETSLLTTHGYSFGKGLYGGLGLGVGLAPDSYAYLNVPLFMDIRYSPLKNMVSPFVDFKLGGIYEYELNRVGLMVSPSVGLDIRRWSIFFKYSYRRHTLRMYTDGAISMSIRGILATHNFALGVAFTFGK